MSNLVDHARTELEAAGLLSKESDYDGMIGEAVLELVEKFAEQGHSGMSASIVSNVFDKVARFLPLVPLTGANDEWNEVGEGHFQNKRCSHVFKDADGEAYDSQGRIFREPNGVTYMGMGSRVPVTFPYTPHSETVDVDATP